jgi:hypothetical protein
VYGNAYSAGPAAGVVIDGSGNIFGITGAGGSASEGDIFEISGAAAGSSPIFASLSNDILTITGTPNADLIAVTESSGQITATLNGQSEGPFAASGIIEIIVNALAGPDSVSLAGQG